MLNSLAIVLIFLILSNINDYSNGQQMINSNSKFSNLESKLNKLESSKPYSAIEGFLLSKKPLDCHQFDTDLIECFAYNLFLKNSHKFQDLDPENALTKPILTKQFENKTVNVGQNVTFTCQTQIDALPIFLFYKLNKDISKIYNSISLDNNGDLLDMYSESLQDIKSLSDYIAVNPRIKIERREHSQDSNKDSLSDLETVNLRITNTIKQDTGYYLCIVANSLKSFRVTYSFLNIISEDESLKQKDSESLIESFQKIENKITIFMYENKYATIGIILILLFSFTLFMSLCCCCCCNLNKHNSQRLKLASKNGDYDDGKLTNDKVVSSIIEKTMNSMKKNFMYVSMSHHSPGRSSSNTENSSIHLNVDCSMEKSLLHNYRNASVISTTNEMMPFDLNESTLFSHKFDEVNYLDEFSTWEFPREKLKLGRLIDEGAFGRVYMGEAYGIIPGRYKSVVAIKMLKENASKNEFFNFIRELEIMKNVGKHENIINLLGCCTKFGPLYAIVEYAKFGNLRNYLRTQRPKDYMLYTGIAEDTNDYEEDKFECDNDNTSHNLSNILKLYSNVNLNKTNSKAMSTFGTLKNDMKIDSMMTKEDLNDLLESDCLSQLNLIIDLLRFCVQVSNGMRYLHTKKVCHRDLAARNILLDENKVAKIADFGFARDLQQNYYYKRKSESPIPVKWMAPETLFDRKVYQNSDIWSFGVLMWEVFTLGGNPYPSVQVEKLFEYLKEGNRMSKPMYADDEIYQLMLECWSFKSDLRPSFDIINQRLSLILEKYEIKRNQKLNGPITEATEKLFDEKAMNDLKNVGLNFNTLTTNVNHQMKSSRTMLNNITATLNKTNSLTNSLTINPTGSECPPLLPSASSSIMTMLSSRNNLNRNDNGEFGLKTLSKLNKSQNTTKNRQSESEDSQYFSGADTSLVYADSSQFSSASSNYTHYSVPLSDDAVKAATVMAASLSQPPPSPPPLKPLSRLLNLASAAYQL